MTPFFVLAYPRSRTAWLAAALTDGRNYCYHEASALPLTWQNFCNTVPRTGTCIGNSDCGNVFLLPKILAQWPNARLILIERDTVAVQDSLRRIGLVFPEAMYHRAEEGFAFARRIGALCVPFDRIGQQGPEIWAHCIGSGFNAQRWALLDAMNIQSRRARNIRHELLEDRIRRQFCTAAPGDQPQAAPVGP